MTSLRKRAFRGMQWNMVGTLVNGVLQMAVMAILARLVDPAEFGVLAVANLCVGFAGYFSNLGVVPAVIRSSDLSDARIQTAHGISVLFSFVLAGILWVGAPFSVRMMDSPQLPRVIQLMGVNFLIMGFGIMSNALLRRELRFGYLAIVQMASYIVGYFFVGIPMALMGYGVWALVSSLLVQTSMRAGMQYLAVRHPVKPIWSLVHVKSILAFGTQHSLSGFLEFLGNSADRFCVGKFFGAAALGLYTRGAVLICLPGQYLGIAINNVLLPSFSEAQHDLDRMKRGYLKGMAASSLLMLSFALAMAPVAKPLIQFVLGARWEGSWPAFVGYGFIAWLGMAASMGSTVVDVIGKQRMKLIIQLSTLVVFVVGLGAAVVFKGRFGWIVSAVLLGYVFRTLCFAIVVGRILGGGWEMLSTFAGGLYLGGVLCLFSWGGSVLLGGLSVCVWLPLALSLGALLAGFGLFFVKIPYVSEMLEVVLESYPQLMRVPILAGCIRRIK